MHNGDPSMHPKSLIETDRWSWSRLRVKVLKRAGYACELCGSVTRLEVDHIIPRIVGGTDALDNLRAICHSCHKRRAAGALPNTARPANPLTARRSFVSPSPRLRRIF